MPIEQALFATQAMRETEFAAKSIALLGILERFAQAKAAQDFYASMQDWELDEADIAEKAAQAQIDQTSAERDAMRMLADALQPPHAPYKLMA